MARLYAAGQAPAVVAGAGTHHAGAARVEQKSPPRSLTAHFSSMGALAATAT